MRVVCRANDEELPRRQLQRLVSSMSSRVHVRSNLHNFSKSSCTSLASCMPPNMNQCCFFFWLSLCRSFRRGASLLAYSDDGSRHRSSRDSFIIVSRIGLRVCATKRRRERRRASRTPAHLFQARRVAQTHDFPRTLFMCVSRCVVACACACRAIVYIKCCVRQKHTSIAIFRWHTHIVSYIVPVVRVRMLAQQVLLPFRLCLFALSINLRTRGRFYGLTHNNVFCLDRSVEMYVVEKMRTNTELLSVTVIAPLRSIFMNLSDKHNTQQRLSLNLHVVFVDLSDCPGRQAKRVAWVNDLFVLWEHTFIM